MKKNRAQQPRLFALMRSFPMRLRPRLNATVQRFFTFLPMPYLHPKAAFAWRPTGRRRRTFMAAQNYSAKCLLPTRSRFDVLSLGQIPLFEKVYLNGFLPSREMQRSRATRI